MSNILEESKGAVTIPGYPHYKVSIEGDVYSFIGKPRKLKPGIVQGYARVVLSKDKKTSQFSIHRLVMLAFVGPSDLQVNHKDFNKLNNHMSNLEYVTHSENMRWNIESGHSHVGELNKRAILDWAQVLTIYTLANRHSWAILGKTMKVEPETISAIAKGKIWKHLHYNSPVLIKKTRAQKREGMPKATTSKKIFSEQEEIGILNEYENGSLQRLIAEKRGVSVSTIEKAIQRARKLIVSEVA